MIYDPLGPLAKNISHVNTLLERSAKADLKITDVETKMYNIKNNMKKKFKDMLEASVNVIEQQIAQIQALVMGGLMVERGRIYRRI